MTPEVAVEVQEFWLMKDTKARDFRDSQQPERRHKRHRPWPRAGRWFRNDPQYVYCRDADRSSADPQ